MTRSLRSESIITGDCHFTQVFAFDSENQEDLLLSLAESASELPGADSEEDSDPSSKIELPQTPEKVSLETVPLEKVYQLHEVVSRFDTAHTDFKPRMFARVKAQLEDDVIELEEWVRRHRESQPIIDVTSQMPILAAPFVQFPHPIVIDEIPLGESSDLNPIGYQTMAVSSDLQEASPSEAELGVSLDQDEPEELKLQEEIPVELLQKPADEPTMPVSEASLPKLNVIQPAWEVQTFRWPEVVNQLCENHKNAFLKLVQSLRIPEGKASARIGIANSRQGQGATSLAICLAKILSDTAGRTILIDSDMRSPGLEKQANIELEAGWQNLLGEPHALNEFLVRATEDKLTLMPLQPRSDLELLQDELLAALSDQMLSLDQHFEFSILDIGNYRNLMVDKKLAIALDAVVLVCDGKMESGNSATVQACEELTRLGMPSVVIAENFRTPVGRAA